MSKIEVDAIEPQSGTSLTLGASGDTVSIPSGVTLANSGTVTGFPAPTSGIAASAIDSGTIATARLGSGTASSTTFLRGDQTYASATPADNSITLAKMASGTDGNIISYDTSGNPVAVATGSSGQILTSAGAGAVPSFQSPAGGGKVLQVVNVTKTDTFTTTTALGSFTDVTGMSVAITPSATSSKVLVLLNATYSQGSNTYGVGFNLDRAGTSVYIGDARGSTSRAVGGTQGNPADGEMLAIQFLDSPNTTSATTYKLQMGTESGGTALLGGTYNTGSSYNVSTASSITLLEIGA